MKIKIITYLLLLLALLYTACAGVSSDINNNDISEQKTSIPAIATSAESMETAPIQNPISFPAQIPSTENVKASEDMYSTAIDLIKHKKFEEALYMLDEVIKLNGNNYDVYFLYAKVLCILFATDEEYFDAKDLIFEYLQKVVNHDPAYKEKIKEEEAFDILMKEFEYYIILGYDTRNDKDLKMIITQCNWYLPGPGVIPIFGGMEFREDNTFNLWYYTPESIDSFLETEEMFMYEGTYEIKKNKIIIRLNEKMLRKRTLYEDVVENTSELEEKQSIEFELQDNGELKTDIFDYSFLSNYPGHQA